MERRQVRRKERQRRTEWEKSGEWGKKKKKSGKPLRK